MQLTSKTRMVCGNLVPFDPSGVKILSIDDGARGLSLRTFFVYDRLLTAESLILLPDIGGKEPSQIRPVSLVVGFCLTNSFFK